MKKILTVILILVMALGLCACGAAKTEAPAVTQAPVQEPVQAQPAAVQVDPTSIEAQINLLFSSLSSLRATDTANTRYTVTDLDHNGRLELICSTTDAANYVTGARMFEVDESFTGIKEIPLGNEVPELVTESADTFHDKTTDTWYYVFSDVGIGPANTTRESYISYKNGVFSSDWIAEEKTEYINGMPVVSFTDRNGSSISPDDYNMSAYIKFSGCEFSSTNFDWFQLAEATSAARLMTSYRIFSGSLAPAVVVAPTVTPAPQSTPVPAPVPDYLVITKNPTSESRGEGETCIFIAKAENASGASWTFLNNGSAYNASQFAQLTNCTVSGADTGSLYVYNANTGLNNWSVYCTFTGRGGQSARTNTVGFNISFKPEYNTTTGSYSLSSSDNYADGIYIPMVGQTVYVSPSIVSHEGMDYEGCPCTVYYTGSVPTGNSGGSIYKVVVHGSAAPPAPVDDYWTCEVCHNIVNGGRTCPTCGADRYTQYWECSQCGFKLNTGDNCEKCGTYRGGAGAGWDCIHCGTFNLESDAFCAGCGRNRGGEG